MCICAALYRHLRGLDLRNVCACGFGHAAGQGGELHRFQEADQPGAVRRLQHQIIQRVSYRDIVLQPYEFAGDARLVGIFDDRQPPLLLLDLAGALKQHVETAEHVQQLGGGLRSNPRNAGHIVHGVAGQSLQVDHLLRRDAPLLDDFRYADLPVLHRVVHRHARADQLHQILVGRYDGDVAARFLGQPRIGRDQIVRLIAFHLQTGQVEGARGLADEAELRDQVVGRRRAVGLVFGVELVAESPRRIVEDDSEMRGRDTHRRIARVAQKFPDHVAETQHRADR